MKRCASVPARMSWSIFPILAVVLAVAIFIFDTVTDLEIAGAVLYVAVVLISLRFVEGRRHAGRGGVRGVNATELLPHTTGSTQSGLVNMVIMFTAIGATNRSRSKNPVGWSSCA